MYSPAFPLAAYQHYRTEFDDAFHRVMNSGRYILGPEVEEFESAFASYLGLRFAVGLASGTEALWLALRAARVGDGDKVVAPSLTASATIAAIVETGARPVFVDLDPASLTIDPRGIAQLVDARTRAIVPVHLYGNPADMTAIMALARTHGLTVIEDCAQAHGARHKGKLAGTFGDAAAWSFYPTKNLGAFGDGGIVTTDDPKIADRLRSLREYGWRERYHSSEHGWNSRLDELQAAFLRVRLQHLDEDNARRREIARRYRAALPAELRSSRWANGDESAEHLFVIRHPRRDLLREKLRERGVGTAVHYPYPCHLQPAYLSYGEGPGSLPITEQACREVLSLPMYPELADEAVERVIEAVCQALEEI
jgi:dTDP-4-amino-4,6-dideoxygalactose transaminase